LKTTLMFSKADKASKSEGYCYNRIELIKLATKIFSVYFV